MNQSAPRQTYYDIGYTNLQPNASYYMIAKLEKDFSLMVYEYRNGVHIDRYYSPWGVQDSAWFNSRWTNPFIYFAYRIDQDFNVIFSDGQTVLRPTANLTIATFPDLATLVTDAFGNYIFAPPA